jgi:glycogen synthase
MEDFKAARVKICIFAPNFFPMVGGLETVTADIANGLVQLGCEVKIITLTLAESEEPNFAFEVHRKPGFWKGLQIARWADLFVMFNVSLKGMPLWLFSGRPLIVSHHTLNPPSFLGKLKDTISNRIAKANIGCSKYVAAHFNKGVAIGNPYNERLFTTKVPWSARTVDFVFLGRLVSDKGGDLFVHAMAELKRKGYNFSASIIGNGPEYDNLVKLSEGLSLTGELRFLGIRKGEELVDLLNQHRIMVIPSLWEEPFGVVALEGIATGCIIVGSEGGGLKEAIGACGLTFPNGDLDQLVRCLSDLLREAKDPNTYLSNAEDHLKKHTVLAASKAYLSVFKD